MSLIAMIRHGPTPWNESKRLQGQRDIPLSLDGRRTVAGWRLPDEFREFDWFCSPLTRTRETARMLGIEAEVAQPIKEMDWGGWDGHTMTELRAKFGDIVARREAQGIDLRPDRGESPREVRQRVAAWINHIMAERARPIGMVTHQGVIRAVLSLATGWDMVGPPPHKMAWAAVQLFRLDGDAVRIERLDISLER